MRIISLEITDPDELHRALKKAHKAALQLADAVLEPARE